MLGFLVGALATLMVAVPASALAGTFTWDLGTDFTATAPGANPDIDQYGGAPWSYVQGNTVASRPSTFGLLSTFTAGVAGGLSEWSTSSGPPLVGVNTTGGSIPTGNATILPHQTFVQPAAGKPVAVEWTSPLGQVESVSVNGTISSDGTGAACTWKLEDRNGTSLLRAGTNPTSFGTTLPVAPGASIFLVVFPTAGSSCDATGVSLTISAPATAPPVTLTSPASGSSSTVNQPTFSGAAGTNWGDGSQITVRVYSGHAATGTPVQTVTRARTGATWSATLGSPLALGVYTARAEQDNVAGDQGFSDPVTFGVGVPVVSLNSPGSGPLSTSTPTLTGTAGTEASEQPYATVVVYAGTVAKGPALRTITVPVAVSGQFSAQITPALPDGTYTALAVQGDLTGDTGASAPLTFSVDTQPPVVTLISPGKGSRADLLQLVFKGTAATASFDSNVVTVTVYRGRKASGKGLRTLNALVTGSTWSAAWSSGTLAPAVYTVQASQTDALGHLGLSAAHTFRVVPLPPVIGGVTINPAGRVSVDISCNEPSTDICTGTVLVLTKGEFATLAGGPVGRLTVMFAYVKIRGGRTSTITRTVLPGVAAVLPRRAGVPVTISANLRPLSGKSIHATAREGLRRVAR
jgi:hypothetical protein